MKLCEQLVHELANHKDAWPFIRPVTRREVRNCSKLLVHMVYHVLQYQFLGLREDFNFRSVVKS